ncbi:MAG TPA: hypothetical protein VM431_00265 [Phycisphaerae bacterium]|nr:hypothetical protein [Phycisphaerae bacterium]
MEPLFVGLRRVRRRLLTVRATEAGLAGAVGGAALAAVVTVLRILRPQAMPLTAQEPLLPLVLIPAGFVAAALVRLAAGATLRDAALAADRAAGLKERLATALEVLDGQRPGLLDDRLLAQAREAAGRLDPRTLRLATTLGRRARIILVAVLVLAAAAFVPSVGGPPLVPDDAQRAAETLSRAADDGSVAPTVRRTIEQAVARLREGGARQGDARDATAAVYQALAEADGARREALRAVAGIDQAEVQKMVRAAARGDASGASGAAADLAGRLGAEPGAGGMSLAARERLADSLDGAARVAAPADLASALAAAAGSVRQAGPDAGATLGHLAAALAEAFGEKGAGGVAAVVAAVGQARRTLGLAESVPPSLAEVAGAGAGPDAAAVGPVATPGEASAGVTASGPAVSVPADVRPEDRDVVRRYFGG